jgi:phosphate-selective porin
LNYWFSLFCSVATLKETGTFMVESLRSNLGAGAASETGVAVLSEVVLLQAGKTENAPQNSATEARWVNRFTWGYRVFEKRRKLRFFPAGCLRP